MNQLDCQPCYKVCSILSLTHGFVASSLQSYREALDSEDYSTAARLRDEGATGLPGWWVADNKDDPKGHLLRISTGFGRYVGYAYTPQDLAQAEVGAPKMAPV